MRVYLRNTKTGQYYASGHQWVSERWQALDLGDIERAAQVAFGEAVVDAEVILRYDEPTCQLALPVRREWYTGSGGGAAG